MKGSGENGLPLINRTFSCTNERLPTIAWAKSHIYTGRKWVHAGEYDREKHLNTRLVRESYIGQAIVLLTENS